MGPRSAGFDDIEAGYAQQAAEEEAEEIAFDDEEDNEESSTTSTAHIEEEDELALAEREYLNEMRSGMHIAEEDGISI